MLRTSLILSALSATALSFTGCNQENEQLAMESQTGLSSAPTVQQYQGAVVDASCGQCQFDLPGSGCNLAVRIDCESYFVDGSEIDDHGDAHAAEGFCNAVRQARVTGHVENGRFASTQFELLPEKSD